MAVVGRQPWGRQHGLNRPYWEAVRDTIAGAFEAGGERHEALLGAVARALCAGLLGVLSILGAMSIGGMVAPLALVLLVSAILLSLSGPEGR